LLYIDLAVYFGVQECSDGIELIIFPIVFGGQR
jgi:hypothetical protein